MKGHFLDIETLRFRARNHHRAELRRLSRKKLAILEKFNYSCAYCGDNERLTIDHIKSVQDIIVQKGKLGLKNARKKVSRRVSNLKHVQILCWSCHTFKNTFLYVFNKMKKEGAF